jgi:tRNA1(Val) A37 N6-methylase TrmN6
MDTAEAPETTEDALMGGRVRLRQPKTGYRAGLDAALLGAAIGAAEGERVLEAGCGAGAALLQAAARARGRGSPAWSGTRRRRGWRRTT